MSFKVKKAINNNREDKRARKTAPRSSAQNDVASAGQASLVTKTDSTIAKLYKMVLNNVENIIVIMMKDKCDINITASLQQAVNYMREYTHAHDNKLAAPPRSADKIVQCLTNILTGEYKLITKPGPKNSAKNRYIKCGGSNNELRISLEKVLVQSQYTMIFLHIFDSWHGESTSDNKRGDSAENQPYAVPTKLQGEPWNWNSLSVALNSNGSEYIVTPAPVVKLVPEQNDSFKRSKKSTTATNKTILTGQKNIKHQIEIIESIKSNPQSINTTTNNMTSPIEIRYKPL